MNTFGTREQFMLNLAQIFLYDIYDDIYEDQLYIFSDILV